MILGSVDIAAIDLDLTTSRNGLASGNSDMAPSSGELVQRLAALYDWIDEQFCAFDFSHSGTVDAVGDGSAIYTMLHENAMTRLWEPLRQAFEASPRLDGSQFAAVFLTWLGIDDQWEQDALEGLSCFACCTAFVQEEPLACMLDHNKSVCLPPNRCHEMFSSGSRVAMGCRIGALQTVQCNGRIFVQPRSLRRCRGES